MILNAHIRDTHTHTHTAHTYNSLLDTKPARMVTGGEICIKMSLLLCIYLQNLSAITGERLAVNAGHMNSLYKMMEVSLYQGKEFVKML